MQKILITGGTGLTGRILSKILIKKGYRVAWLSRSGAKEDGIEVFHWDISKREIDSEALIGVDFILHLAGASIAEKRWTPERRQIILDSRIASADLLYEKVSRMDRKPKGFISASAIGYYGVANDEKIFSEEDGPTDDFIGSVCSKWEKATDQFLELGVRTVKFRIGVVLSNKGGALEKMAMPAKWGLGAPLGDGRQYMPWIHIEDLCTMFVKAIEEEGMKGAYNAVAPQHLTNEAFTRSLTKALKRSMFPLNVPGFVLKMALGELAEMLLKGSRVSSEKIRKADFEFKFPTVDDALEDLL